MALGRVDTPKVEASFWLVEESKAPSNFREVFPRMAPRTPRSSEIMGLAFLPRSLGVPALRVSLFLSVILLAPLEKLVGGLDDPGLFKHRDSFGHPHRLFSLDAFLPICRPFHRGGTLHNCAVPHRIQQVYPSLRR